MASKAAYARAFKQRQQERGLRQFVDWVPPRAFADLRRMCELLRDDPELEVALLVNRKNRQWRGLKRAAAPRTGLPLS